MISGAVFNIRGKGFLYWLVVSTILKILVSWDIIIPNICKNKNVPNHQPGFKSFA